jgi:DNA phosphorothioation-associated putative methyltransferase
MAEVPCKIVGADKYVHISSIENLPTNEVDLIRIALIKAEEGSAVSFNLIRIHKSLVHLSLLNYPLFDEQPFPEIKESWRYDVVNDEVLYRSFENSVNPPILHRKELFLSRVYPGRDQFEALTRSAEAIGLFDNPTRIGYRNQWYQLIEESGYELLDYELIPLPDQDGDEDDCTVSDDVVIARHLTALVRYGFSAPIQSLTRYGFLGGNYTLFDYGCGRGSDVKGLQENDIQASGWDPYYASDNQKVPSDIVNLGFVINVIESVEERVKALQGAYALADKLLVVSVMLDSTSRGMATPYLDGVVTKRGTFQKYFTQLGIKSFIESNLSAEAIAVAPGIHYIFKDKDVEQKFLANRYSSRRNVLSAPRGMTPEQKEEWKRRRSDKKYADNKELLDKLWVRWIALGRRPEKSEFEHTDELATAFGSYNKALHFLLEHKDEELVEEASLERQQDLEVYFALSLFEKRKPYAHMENGLQRDIKTFFGSYSAAQEAGKGLLFSIADTALMHSACRYAASQGYGYLDDDSLQLHTSLVERLPSILRVYIGCASMLYGDYRNSDLVKVHIHSGKISLMKYDEFESHPLPKMVERVKISLRQQDFDYFEYGEEYVQPYLYRKSLYINEEFPMYPEQVVFEERLVDLNGLDLSGFGPQPDEFDLIIKQQRLEVDGFNLSSMRSIPMLDDSCGEFLKYRDMIECGETWSEHKIDNLPQQVESYNALHELSTLVLDPVIDYFGMIMLTYGFCSPQLSKLIPGRIAPKLDQHAAYELNRLKRPICSRLGAACDFYVEYESMLDVAQWIVQNTGFDRLYYYGDEVPLHVSIGPEQSRKVVLMLSNENGKRVPRNISNNKFLQFSRILDS